MQATHTKAYHGVNRREYLSHILRQSGYYSKDIRISNNKAVISIEEGTVVIIGDYNYIADAIKVILIQHFESIHMEKICQATSF